MDLPVYTLPEPPYALLVIGLLISLTSGIAFDSTLRQAVKDWSKNRSTRTLVNLRGSQLFVPFLGISIGILLFLASGLEIFGFFPPLTYILSVVLTVLTNGLIWFQLGRILKQLERGGSKALDLDAWE